MTWTECYFEND